MFNKELKEVVEKMRKTLYVSSYGVSAAGRYTQKSVIDRISEIEEELGKYTECKTCGCLIKKDDKFAVKEFRGREFCLYYGKFHDEWEGVSYYCLTHKPPYDKMIDGKYYKDNVEVDDKGRIIKSK
jgi:hypothetical protein